MTLIALATCFEQAELYHDEAPFVAELKSRNFEVFPVVWNSPEIDWQCYDIVVIRNTWDYHLQVQTFRAWLDYLDARGIPVLNPTELIRWNMDKTYLQVLANNGVKILPTIFTQGQKINLKETLKEKGWSQAVVKPTLSASGDNTWMLTPETADESQQRFDWLNEQIGMMVQIFAPQIHSEGEYSLVFFNGVYSHTVIKKPAKDSLFVHEERGGSLQEISVPENIVTQAKVALQIVEDITGIMPTYARVDGLCDEDNFVLMELECIEPELYFSHSVDAAKRLANLITEAIP